MPMPAHEVTEKSRMTAKTASGFGLPQPMIARLLGITEPTLVKYYFDDLADGKALATMQVAKTLFHRATEGKDLGAAIFWLKTQAGWREKHVLDDPAARKGLAELIALSGLKADPGQPALPAPGADQPDAARLN